MSITVEDYNATERLARSKLSFQEILAFAPTAMEVTGFPTRVENEAQIASFMDWNDGDGTNVLFDEDFYPVRALQTKFTASEVALGRSVADIAARLTKERTGHEMRPIISLVAMFGLFRIVQAIKAARNLPQISVFEVGPGNGYLGALLALCGDRYAATDNSQALYLWQNRLLEACAPGEFCDWADGPPAEPTARIQHLPWWEYVGLRHREPLNVDIFISNCNLCEMNRYALKYTTRIARKLLDNSPIGQFMYVSTGNPLHNSNEAIELELTRSGFAKVYGMLFQCFSCKPLAKADTVAFGSTIPLFGQGPVTDTAGFLSGIGIGGDNLPFDIDFISFIGFENHFVDNKAFQALTRAK